MYDTIVSVIESGHYELADMLNKIDTLWVQGDLDNEQREYLMTRARENADPVNSYVDTPTQLASIFSRLHDLELAVTAINKSIESLAQSVEELGKPAEIEKPSETVDTSYPEWRQPTCAVDCYNTGDTCTYNGKKYKCLIDGCVWSPDVYPAGWSEVKDEGSTEPTDPEEPDTPEPEEWPEFVQPTGAHDAYKTGDKVTYNGKHYVDKVTYNGKHYVSLIDSNTWSPDAYPQGWQEQTEEPEPEQEV